MFFVFVLFVVTYLLVVAVLIRVAVADDGGGTRVLVPRRAGGGYLARVLQ